jgi:hypothetical protein
MSATRRLAAILAADVAGVIRHSSERTRTILSGE